MSEYEGDTEIVDRPDETLDTQWIPREELEPNDWNPNRMDEEERQMLKRSILNNGWTRPIVVHAEEMYIIDGEQRWTVAQDEEIQTDEGLTPDGVPAGHVPVFGITVEEDEAKVSTIQHNRARGFVSYDSLGEYLDVFHDDDQLDDLSTELDFDTDDMLRIVENEGVAESIHGDGHDLNPPWEPRDIREFDDDELDESTRTRGLEESSEAMRDGETEDTPDVERVTAVLSEDELERVHKVFSEEQTAFSVVEYINLLDEQDLIDAFQDTVGIEPDEEHPHPEEATE